jgi:hypothetical protein
MIVDSFGRYTVETIHDHESTRGARRVDGWVRTLDGADERAG